MSLTNKTLKIKKQCKKSLRQLCEK